jgi:imidazole glycerol-phosphate synthase subunit HisH
MGKVGILDYGGGNFRSVKNAFDYLKVDSLSITSAKDLDEVSHVIVPGVGAFSSVMTKLVHLPLFEELIEHVTVRGKFFLGICVGMQVLASVGLEFGEHDGLGWIPGSVKKIESRGENLQLPHIGWNDVQLHSPSNLYLDIEDDSTFYFVHSYHFNPEESKHVSGTVQYGETVVASVEKDNIYGVQFHPEKSQLNGLKLLENFSRMA